MRSSRATERVVAVYHELPDGAVKHVDSACYEKDQPVTISVGRSFTHRPVKDDHVPRLCAPFGDGEGWRRRKSVCRSLQLRKRMLESKS